MRTFHSTVPIGLQYCVIDESPQSFIVLRVNIKRATINDRFVVNEHLFNFKECQIPKNMMRLFDAILITDALTHISIRLLHLSRYLFNQFFNVFHNPS